MKKTVLLLVFFLVIASVGFAAQQEYNDIISAYSSALNGSLSEQELMSMGLCPLLAELSPEEKTQFGYYLEDINGDGIAELFLGLNNSEYNDSVYQLWTVSNGQAACLYTATDDDGVYLFTDGILEYETWGDDGSYGICLYRLNSDGSVTVTEGLLYIESAQNGTYYSISDDSFNPSTGKPISEDAFNNRIDEYLMREKYLSYEPVSNWTTGTSPKGIGRKSRLGSGTTNQNKTADNSASQKSQNDVVNTMPQSNSGSTSDTYYTIQTFTDPTTSAKVANVLVPDGWNTSLKVDWEVTDTTAPGQALIKLTSPDGKTKIQLVSNMHFFDIYANGSRVGEGRDTGLYLTVLHYRNANDVQALGLQAEGYSNYQFVRSYPIADSMLETAQEGARLLLQNNASSINATPISSEGTVAQNLYKCGNTYIEYFTFVMAARYKSDSGYVSMDTTSWYMPFGFLFVADSEQAYNQYRDVFLNVVGNSGFTTEFHYVNLKYGEQINSLISAGLIAQSQAYLQSGSSSWISEYEHSSDYDSSKIMNGWSDVIKDQNEYTTLDGETIKVSTSADTVYQNGDQFYFGSDAQSPYGWTRLYPN